MIDPIQGFMIAFGIFMALAILLLIWAQHLFAGNPDLLDTLEAMADDMNTAQDRANRAWDKVDGDLPGDAAHFYEMWAFHNSRGHRLAWWVMAGRKNLLPQLRRDVSFARSYSDRVVHEVGGIHE